MRKRDSRSMMTVVPRLVYNPDKAERGLKAMADILAGALDRSRLRKDTKRTVE